MKPKITLKDIAKELDVSISTVSKSLKNSKEISKETKDRIRAFAKFYNYRPNNIALSLKNKRSNNIGVIIPDIVHHFFTTVFRGIEKYANEKGYNVIICVSNESLEKEASNMEMLANGSIDGFIISVSAKTEMKKDYTHLNSLINQGIPIVMFDRVTENVRCDKVILNDLDITFEAVSHFIKSGCKRIGLITTEAYFMVSENRKRGYLKALEENGLDIEDNLILSLPFNMEHDELITQYFKKQKVDAVLCVNEIFAVQSIGIIQELGLKIPQDISVVGFTDGMLSKFSRPRLTTVNQHGDEMGEKAAKLLIERIEGNADNLVFKTEEIKATLVKRESTFN